MMADSRTDVSIHKVKEGETWLFDAALADSALNSGCAYARLLLVDRSQDLMLSVVRTLPRQGPDLACCKGCGHARGAVAMPYAVDAYVHVQHSKPGASDVHAVATLLALGSDRAVPPGQVERGEGVLVVVLQHRDPCDNIN